MALEFSPEAYKKFEETVNRYQKERAAMLPVLYLAQQELGHPGPEAIEHVAQLMGQSPARVHGVVSFYTMLNTKPIGRHHIQVCRTLSCALRAEQLTGFLKKTLGIVGQTTADGRFTLSEVECLASQWHRADDAGQRRLLRESDGREGHRDTRFTEIIRFVATMEKVLLRNIDVPDSDTLAVYRSRGGYRAWEKVVQSMNPEQVIEEVKASVEGAAAQGFLPA